MGVENLAMKVLRKVSGRPKTENEISLLLSEVRKEDVIETLKYLWANGLITKKGRWWCWYMPLNSRYESEGEFILTSTGEQLLRSRNSVLEEFI